MDIKEIAQKRAPGYWKRDQWNTEYFDSVGFAEALIESYKAELLKEAGEPVGCHYLPNNEMFPVEEVSRSNLKNNPQDYVFLYTSNQVAAAILKATGSLEEEVERLKVRHSDAWVEIDKLRTQLASAQEEIKTVTEQKNRMWFEMQTAQDQLAKAEQRVAEYNELIYAVQTKHHDETRHQTALRYIRNAENRQSYTAANGASS